jgi:hypothetical protein
MELDNITTPPLVYNYQALDEFFDQLADPRQIAGYLDHLLHFLVYYEHKELYCDYYPMYSEIFELKQILQTMIREEAHGNN